MDCDACYEENPRDYVKQELCPTCPRGKQQHNPLLTKLLEYLGLMDSGCPLGRHELTNHEWRMIGLLKNERAELQIKAAERDGGRRRSSPGP